MHNLDGDRKMRVKELKNYPVSVDVIAVRPEELMEKESLSLMTTNAIHNGRILVSR
jgi:hypothetical protein